MDWFYNSRKTIMGFIKENSVLFILGITLSSYLIFFINGLHNSHDIRAHILWFEHFTNQSDGIFSYPRFLIDANMGFGSPAFYYYPPLPYFFLNTIHYFFSLNASLALPLVCFISVSTGALGIHRLTKQLGAGTIPAVVAACFYVTSPYLYLVDTVFRFSFAEIFVIGVLPYLFIKYDKKYFLTIVSFFVFLSHPPTSLIVLPFAYLWQWKVNEEKFFTLVVNGILSLSMSAFYVMPAILIPNPSMDIMWELYSVDRSYINKAIDFGSPTSFQSVLRITSWSLGLLSIVLFYNIRGDKIAKWSFSFCMIAFLMMLSFSSFFYELISIYEKIQFRWRWNSLLLLGFTILLALNIVKSKIIKAITILYSFNAILFPIILTTFGSMHFLNSEQIELTIKSNIEVPEYSFNRSPTDSEKFDTQEGILNDNELISATSWGAFNISFEHTFKPNDKLIVRRNRFYNFIPQDPQKYSIIQSESAPIEIIILQETDSVTLIAKEFEIESNSKWISVLGLFLFAIHFFYVTRIGNTRQL